MEFFNDWADEVKLSTREKALRDLFVKEYLVDFDAISACLRCGFTSVTAQQYAHKFMEEGYVQKKLATEQAKFGSVDDVDSKEALKQQIITGLIREAHNRGTGSSHSARVAALSKLASIVGLDAVNKLMAGEQSGVMMVPAIASLDDWEAAAQASQEKLAHDSVVH